MLTGKQRAALRAMANEMETIAQIGKGGLSENVIAQIDEALTARELIKVKVHESAGESARDICGAVCEAVSAEPVSVVGGRFVLYRRSDKAPKIQLK